QVYPFQSSVAAWLTVARVSTQAAATEPAITRGVPFCTTGEPNREGIEPHPTRPPNLGRAFSARGSSGLAHRFAPRHAIRKDRKCVGGDTYDHLERLPRRKSRV